MYDKGHELRRNLPIRRQILRKNVHVLTSDHLVSSGQLLVYSWMSLYDKVFCTATSYCSYTPSFCGDAVMGYEISLQESASFSETCFFAMGNVFFSETCSCGMGNDTFLRENGSFSENGVFAPEICSCEMGNDTVDAGSDFSNDAFVKGTCFSVYETGSYFFFVCEIDFCSFSVTDSCFFVSETNSDCVLKGCGFFCVLRRKLSVVVTELG